VLYVTIRIMSPTLHYYVPLSSNLMNRVNACVTSIFIPIGCHMSFMALIQSRYGLLLLLRLCSPLLGLGRIHQIFNPLQSRKDSLDGGSAPRKASTYTGQQTEFVF
jgi:hypothetical protein